MIKYYYKYIPLRTAFFKDLMLRATQFRALNDPFEGKFNKLRLENAIRDMDAFAIAHGYDPVELSETTMSDHVIGLESDLESVGVISFSEDFTNPIMWAHYAD